MKYENKMEKTLKEVLHKNKGGFISIIDEKFLPILLYAIQY